jgi:hypothetical protein
MTGESGIPRGIALALPVATGRGSVLIFIPSLVNIGDFIIAGNGRFIIVRVRFSHKIHADAERIAGDYRANIGRLRSARSGSVSCELWLYSRYETFRYFRIGDSGIDEIDSNGNPLASAISPDTVKSEHAGPGAAGASGPVPALPVEQPDPYEIFRRWVRKRNAVRKAAGIRDFHDPAILELMCRECDEKAIPSGKAGEKARARNPAKGMPGKTGEGI